jgi:hypothetical protein
VLRSLAGCWFAASPEVGMGGGAPGLWPVREAQAQAHLPRQRARTVVLDVVLVRTPTPPDQHPLVSGGSFGTLVSPDGRQVNAAIRRASPVQRVTPSTNDMTNVNSVEAGSKTEPMRVPHNRGCSHLLQDVKTSLGQAAGCCRGPAVS